MALIASKALLNPCVFLSFDEGSVVLRLAYEGQLAATIEELDL